jgi:hypothetical protein
MENWQPTVKDENKTNLELTTDYGYGSPIETYAHLSEGDTLYIRQEVEGLPTMYVHLGRYELYDLIFNFMSVEELVEIASRKEGKHYKKI